MIFLCFVRFFGSVTKRKSFFLLSQLWIFISFMWHISLSLKQKQRELITSRLFFVSSLIDRIHHNIIITPFFLLRTRKSVACLLAMVWRAEITKNLFFATICVTGLCGIIKKYAREKNRIFQTELFYWTFFPLNSIILSLFSGFFSERKFFFSSNRKKVSSNLTIFRKWKLITISTNVARSYVAYFAIGFQTFGLHMAIK